MAELLTEGPRVRAFLREYVRQTKGRWAGEPLEVEGWQAEFLDEAFELDSNTGLRVYNEAYLGIPRKNGKSTLGSGVALYLLVADGEESPEVYAGAGKKDQARVVFDQAAAIVRKSPGLLDWLRVQRSDIFCEANNGIFKVLASDGELEFGSNPSGGVLDEIWTHKSRKLHTALTTGTAAREQPFTLGITTAGYSKVQLLGEIYDRSMALPDVEKRDFLTICRDRENGFLLFWYGPRAGEKVDLEDPEVWKACNPASWVTPAYLRKQRHKPSQIPDEFLRFHVNAWTEVAESWLEPGEWDACEVKDARIPDGADAIAIVDVGIYHDSSAVTLMAQVDDRIVVETHVWALHKDPAKSPPPAHTLIKGKGPLKIELLEDHIREVNERVRLVSVVYDPRFFIRSAQALEDEGFQMVEWKPSRPTKIRESRRLYEAISEKRIAHNGDKVLAAHVAAGARNVKYDGWCLDKQQEKDGPPNDALMTLMMGIEEIEQAVEEAGCEW